MTEPLALDLDALHGRRTAGPLDAVGLDQAWTWRVWVPGRPVPQGSKKPMPIYKGTGPHRVLVKIVMIEQRSDTLKVWRAAVESTAREAWPTDTCESAVHLGCRFLLPPWKSTRANDYPTGSRTGDMSKLVRAVEDALTAAEVWTDDRLVTGYLGWPLTSKRFARAGEEPGCEIVIRPAPPAVNAP